MAKILIIDDNATNRKVLSAILQHEGHQTIEARDGVDGLVAVRSERPNLVMSDILMPTMDGYEFVRQLRADPEGCETPVIFHTAHYHEREAKSLAQQCHVRHVLSKPAIAADVLATVDQVLSGKTAAPRPIAAEFDREHLRLVTNKLSENMAELRAANARLAALTELNIRLASEREPRALLESVCQAARELLGARFAVLAVAEPSPVVTASGLDAAVLLPERLDLHSGALGTVFSERRPLRVANTVDCITATGLPGCCPPVHALLAAPLCSLSRIYGWVCLGDKIGAHEFDAEDERILATLGAQVGRIYENGSLYREVEQHAAQLVVEMEKRELAATELRESETRFRQIAQNIHDVFFLIAADQSRTFYLSPAYERIFGRTVASAYQDSHSWMKAIHRDDLARIQSATRRYSGGIDNRTFEFRIVRPDGSVRWILARTFPIADGTGAATRMAGIATDITERKEAEARIEHLNRVYAVLSGINSLIVRVQDRNQLLHESCRLAVETGRFRFAWCAWRDAGTREYQQAAWAGDSPELARLLGESEPRGAETLVAAAMSSRLPELSEETQEDPRLAAYRPEILARGYQSIIALPLNIGNQAVGCMVLATAERGFFDARELRLLVELAGDISFALDHIQKAERLNYLAYYDEITGVANRALFHERLSIHLTGAARAEQKLALIVVQIDRFESIGDTLGRKGADRLIAEAAERFTRCVGNRDVVARIGPDQLAAIIPDIADEAAVIHALDTWWPAWLGVEFRIDGSEFRLAAHAGVAVFPADGTDADTLLKHADAAVKNARATGERQLFYTQHLSERGAAKLALENRLRRALENEEYRLFYQPKIDLDTRRVMGVEALLRWQNPEAGLVSPAEFIPLMEETGMIVEVGAWALRQACLDRSRWLELGFKAPRIAVNVSTVQLRRKDFVRMVKNTLRTAGSTPGIDIEVTESLIMQDAADNIAKLAAIRDLGVQIAIDDFGTGYSSLGYLTKLPVSVLKIDRSFVISMLDDPSAMTLVSTIISLAHALRLEVVAEGVESEEQAKILRLVRCDQMQGYLISHPLPFDDMTAFLGRNRT